MNNSKKNLRRSLVITLSIVLVLLALGFTTALSGRSMDRAEAPAQVEIAPAVPAAPSDVEAPPLDPMWNEQAFSPTFVVPTLHELLAQFQEKEDDC